MYCVLEVRGGKQGKGWALCKNRGHTLAGFVPKEKEVNEKHRDPATIGLLSLRLCLIMFLFNNISHFANVSELICMGKP